MWTKHEWQTGGETGVVYPILIAHVLRFDRNVNLLSSSYLVDLRDRYVRDKISRLNLILASIDIELFFFCRKRLQRPSE